MQGCEGFKRRTIRSLYTQQNRIERFPFEYVESVRRTFR